jgi:hypothetical protein
MSCFLPPYFFYDITLGEVPMAQDVEDIEGYSGKTLLETFELLMVRYCESVQRGRLFTENAKFQAVRQELLRRLSS